MVKSPPAVQEMWFNPLGRSPGEENDNPLQYSCMGSPMDRGAWRATVHGVVIKRVGPNLVTKQQHNNTFLRFHLFVFSHLPISFSLLQALPYQGHLQDLLPCLFQTYLKDFSGSPDLKEYGSSLEVQYCCFSVPQSCLTLCDPIDCNTPGLPVPHHLLKFAQIHVLWSLAGYSPWGH